MPVIPDALIVPFFSLSTTAIVRKAWDLMNVVLDFPIFFSPTLNFSSSVETAVSM